MKKMLCIFALALFCASAIVIGLWVLWLAIKLIWILAVGGLKFMLFLFVAIAFMIISAILFLVWWIIDMIGEFFGWN